MNGEELATAMADAVNSGIGSEAVVTAVRREHNWLQRRLFNQVVKPIIVALAGAQHVDDRNRDVVEQSREIAKNQGWFYLAEGDQE